MPGKHPLHSDPAMLVPRAVPRPLCWADGFQSPVVTDDSVRSGCGGLPAVPTLSHHDIPDAFARLDLPTELSRVTGRSRHLMLRNELHHTRRAEQSAIIQ